MTHTARRFRPRTWSTLTTLMLLATFVALGLWQLHRAEEKAAMRADFERLGGDLPVALTGTELDPRAMAYRRVVARGAYLTDRQFLWDNRIHNGRPGYYVLTPLRIAGSSRAVVVNRGWVPLGRTRAELPDLVVPAQTREIEGSVYLPSRGAIVLGAEDEQRGRWPRVIQRVDLERMGARLGLSLLPFTVRLDPGQADGYVRHWRPYYGSGPGKNRAYALQWFSFAVILAILYIVLNLKRAQDT